MFITALLPKAHVPEMFHTLGGRPTRKADTAKFFRQIQADAIGRPLGIPNYGECAVLGAALLGAVGAGAFDSVGQAVASIVTIETVVEPRNETREVYDELHRQLTRETRRLNEPLNCL